ncbi:MAG: hypothetical protein GQ546_09810 [Gammaproteobacteria bacterium]|nr:hypothetical protein [Gammaproteobacteria bacterium]
MKILSYLQCYLQSWLLVGLLLIILVIIIFSKLYNLPSLENTPAKKTLFETAVVDSNCNLHETSCTAFLSDGRAITFAILPRTIPLLKPLKVEVYMENIEAISVDLEIKGVNLYMGKFRTRLKDIGDSIYRGETSLPVCSKKVMHWQAMISVKTKNKNINKTVLAPFHFETTYTPTFIILE